MKSLAPFPNISSLAFYLAKNHNFHSIQAEFGIKTPVILVPDTDFARDLAEELLPWLNEEEALVLPSLETDLLKNRGVSKKTKSDRMNFYCAAHRGRAPLIVPVDSLCQPSLSPESLFSLFLKINLADERSVGSFVSDLVELGYLPSELAETPGTYAARGSIVDVFSPNDENPVRIELFADKIQSIRSFDSATQRKVSELNSFTISPAQEFFYETKKSLSSVVKSYAERNDWVHTKKSSLNEKTENQIHFATLDYWSQIFRPNNFVATYHNFFSFEAVIDPEKCLQSLKISHAEQTDQLQLAYDEGELIPLSKDFLAPLPEAEAYLNEKILSCPLWLGLGKTLTSLKESRPTKNPGIETNASLAIQMQSARSSKEASPFVPLITRIKELHESKIKVLFASPTLSQLERIEFFLNAYTKVKTHRYFDGFLGSSDMAAGLVARVDSGFVNHEQKIAVVTDEEVFGKRKKRAHHKRKNTAKAAFSNDLSLLTLEPGDYVVQSENGVARYVGLKNMRLDGISNELLELEYADGNKLFVPVSRLNTVQRLGGPSTQTSLDKLGGLSWDNKKSKAKREIRSIATELIQLYSKRQLALGPKINPPAELIENFAASFPFEETPDQAKAIKDCIEDLKGPTPMDRLLCGDVGYGKTEVALRAAHAAIVAGFQVAVLVPTTILASQHETVFKKRLEPLGYKVAGASRFKTHKEFNETLEGLESGKIQLTVGTHRLLGERVNFKNLGLLIVDEEQRFGVTHKEKLKRFRSNVHVLTMTATPIPRTLNMAMAGLRELSIISTPPVDRQSVQTHIVRKKPALITQAVKNELKRGGQVFYLHNRVRDIHLIEEELKQLVPEAKISTVHGQMDEKVLEERMLSFYRGETQVLLTTTIIESGLDVPNANTLIVEKANNFGLSQLYQIRGRVGRSSSKAYAYMLLPSSGNISKEAEERLQVLEAYQDLGSGFHIASHDMDIRGAGDLLGRSQSGQMLSIGFDTYVAILEECIAELKGEPLSSTVDPEINIPIESNIPNEYIPEIGLRLSYYKKLASMDSDQEFLELEEELEDRFGKVPTSVLNLLRIMKIKSSLRRIGVKSLTSGKLGYSLVFDITTLVDTKKLVQEISKYPQNYQFSPDGKLIIKMPGGIKNTDEMMKMAENSLDHLESLI